MASIEEKAVGLAAAQQKVEALIKTRSDLKSPRAFGVGSEFVSAFADVAKEFGFEIKAIYPAGPRRT